MKKSLGGSNVWSGIPQQEYQIQSTLDLYAINGGGIAGLFFAFNPASGRHRQWIRLSRTAMSYRIEHQNSNQRGFERWPFGFFFSVPLGIQHVQECYGTSSSIIFWYPNDIILPFTPLHLLHQGERPSPQSQFIYDIHDFYCLHHFTYN